MYWRSIFYSIIFLYFQYLLCVLSVFFMCTFSIFYLYFQYFLLVLSVSSSRATFDFVGYFSDSWSANIPPIHMCIRRYQQSLLLIYIYINMKYCIGGEYKVIYLGYAEVGFCPPKILYMTDSHCLHIYIFWTCLPCKIILYRSKEQIQNTLK